MGREIIRYSMGVLLALSLAACGNDLDTLPQMVFVPYLPGGGSRATDTGFEPGDAIGIYAVGHDEYGQARILEVTGNWASNARAVCNGGEWTVSPPVYWTENGVFDIYSYYPYASNVNSVSDFRFELQGDQRDNGLTLSDFMWAKTSAVTQEGGSVPLHFTHRLSKLTIRLAKGVDYEGELPDDAIVNIHGTVPVALVDLESGDVEKSPDSPAGTITAHRDAPGYYSAIIVPQKILNQIPLVEVIVKDVSYLLSSKFIFESGKRHCVDVILSDNPDKVIISVGGGTDEWN